MRPVFLQFLFFFLPLWAVSADSLQVTYIANEGFLIEQDGQVVAIDAFFTEGLGSFDAPSGTVLNQMKTAQGIFSRIGLILITHAHRDHLDASLVVSHMLANPGSRLVAPEQAVDKLKGEPQFHQIASRITPIGGPFGTVTSVEPLPSMGLEVMMLKHGPFFEGETNRHASVQNCAYLLTLGDKHILHVGDATLDWNRALIPWALIKGQNVDVMFIQFYDLSNESAELVRSMISPKTLIGMHMRKAGRQAYEGLMKATYPQAVLFRDGMESRRF